MRRIKLGVTPARLVVASDLLPQVEQPQQNGSVKVLLINARQKKKKIRRPAKNKTCCEQGSNLRGSLQQRLDLRT